MVPIHYFLALLAVLISLTGCTQKAPPGTPEVNTFNNLSIEKQIVNHGKNPIVKPQDQSETTIFSIEAPNASEWNLNLAGADAKKLYEELEVTYFKTTKENKTLYIKSGKHLACIKSKNKYVCTLNLNSTTGVLKTINNELDLEEQPELSEQYQSPNNTGLLTMDANQAKTARLVILGKNAKMIYESLSDAIVLSPDRFGKRGKNIACYQEILGADSEPSFSCKLFFNFDNGTFEEIEKLY